MYANIVRLLKVLEPLIICTAACEKVFSRVKLIVSEHRNRLKAETNNKPLMIALNRENGGDMNFDKVVELFSKEKEKDKLLLALHRCLPVTQPLYDYWEITT